MVSAMYSTVKVRKLRDEKSSIRDRGYFYLNRNRIVGIIDVFWTKEEYFN